MVRKMILKEFIQFESGEIVYIRINYIGLSKGRLFVIMAIYPTVIYTVLDNNIFKIVIFTNLIKKCLELSKNIWLKIIYKYIDIMYIIIDIFKAFVIVTITFSIFSDPFSAV